MALKLIVSKISATWRTCIVCGNQQLISHLLLLVLIIIITNINDLVISHVSTPKTICLFLFVIAIFFEVVVATLVSVTTWTCVVCLKFYKPHTFTRRMKTYTTRDSKKVYLLIDWSGFILNVNNYPSG